MTDGLSGPAGGGGAARRVSAGAATPRLGLITRAGMWTRLFAVQASWNYELLMGVGIGFCVEPALRTLPGGPDGPRYHEALGRQCRYFNAHPYLASVAIGALARAELDGVPGDKIDRFRTALCGPLGSVGDRLVWAGWLPLCSLLALAVYGLGASPAVVAIVFLGIYNVGHIALRSWGLAAGWAHGMRVAVALGAPLFRVGPDRLARAGALLAGIAIPVAVGRVIGLGAGRPVTAAVWAAGAAGAIFLVRMHGRAEGWRIALGVLAAFVLLATVPHHG
jgi:mannose PTS system EIID component